MIRGKWTKADNHLPSAVISNINTNEHFVVCCCLYLGQFYVMMTPPDVLQSATQRTIAPRTHTYPAWVHNASLHFFFLIAQLSHLRTAALSPTFRNYFHQLPQSCCFFFNLKRGLLKKKKKKTPKMVCWKSRWKTVTREQYPSFWSNIWKPHCVLLTCHPQRRWWKRDVAAWQHKLVRRTFTFEPMLQPPLPLPLLSPHTHPPTVTPVVYTSTQNVLWGVMCFSVPEVLSVEFIFG